MSLRCLPVIVSRIPCTRALYIPNNRRGVSSKSPNQPDDDAPQQRGAFYALPDPIFDNVDIHYFEPSKRAPLSGESHVLNSNWEPMFFNPDLLTDRTLTGEGELGTEGDEAAAAGQANEADEEAMSPLRHLPVPFSQLHRLFRFPLVVRRVVQQTGKGKLQSQYVLTVVGNGAGLVGVGEGTAEHAAQAADKAFAQAVRGMDWVARFEGRTLWTEMASKFGATRVLMRPRPVGFGLMCAPGVHQVLKAAGVKDASVKVWGSRNKINVVKAAVRMLHAGHAPLAMGNGIGGRGRRMEAGSGMRTKFDVERERGRKIVDARTC